jgi:N6-L-threonylcarbamoyladenine synthase
MLILGVETSCDETAAAVVADGREVLSNIISSQADLHAVFGGVVPEVAARRHIECVGAVADEALRRAGVNLADIGGYAVANGPGLAGALLVGLSYTKALAYAQQKPLAGVHHIEGHICANYLGGSWEPPFLALVVSGGHTSLLAVRDYETYELLGRTRDDAAGEAFDKTARVLGLGYPGGPLIDRLAEEGDPTAVFFPRANLGDGSLDFSFSGLKSAVIQYVSKNKTASIKDIAASFRQAVVDVLVKNTLEAASRYKFNKVALAGGVACNRGLRKAMEAACA